MHEKVDYKKRFSLMEIVEDRRGEEVRESEQSVADRRQSINHRELDAISYSSKKVSKTIRDDNVLPFGGLNVTTDTNQGMPGTANITEDDSPEMHRQHSFEDHIVAEMKLQKERPFTSMLPSDSVLRPAEVDSKQLMKILASKQSMKEEEDK